MKLTDKLESVECRRDDKARRVSNVAPDTIANIDEETLEKGVTLESLENLNVPVLRYSTQVTVHGKLPSFNPSARPGGYKAIFQNQNGSIGVRYSAIDACKKALLVRASKVAKNGMVGAHGNGMEKKVSGKVGNSQGKLRISLEFSNFCLIPNK